MKPVPSIVNVCAAEPAMSEEGDNCAIDGEGFDARQFPEFISCVTALLAWCVVMFSAKNTTFSGVPMQAVVLVHPATGMNPLGAENVVGALTVPDANNSNSSFWVVLYWFPLISNVAPGTSEQTTISEQLMDDEIASDGDTKALFTCVPTLLIIPTVLVSFKSVTRFVCSTGKGASG
jgi:hypothetical protein